ncbi:hypothetical protein [Pedobacter sp. MR2016-24]|uniref:hypothetical protein n=1 Tax=Pedobacter sp. MR2016-24 TaxID=2994466 RepID=UPI0022454467|nr:hypothetical protein [Pedobacter sp. MR2016-24]MCX2483543.1 hypothetical protein [Pedobacter sp. MR2016-24]
MNNLNPLFKRTFRLMFSITCMGAICMPQIAAAQKQAITKVTIHKDKYNRIFIPVKVDKDTVPLLFATYAKTLRLTPYFMRTRALYPSGQVLTLNDQRGRKRDRLVFFLPRLDIGNVKFRNEETIVNNAFPDTVATGSTGTLMVYQYNWKIDNDRNEVSLSKKPFTPEQAFTTIRYKNNTSPRTAVQIGELTADFILDFGSGSNIQVNTASDIGRALISKYKLKPVNTITSNIHSPKMVDTVYEVTVPSLLLNGVVVKNQKVMLSSASPQNTIGTGFLGNYNVILNNSKKRKIDSEFILEKRLVD